MGRGEVKNLKRCEYNGLSSFYLFWGFCKNKFIKRINLLRISFYSFCSYNEIYLNEYLINV